MSKKSILADRGFGTHTGKWRDYMETLKTIFFLS